MILPVSCSINLDFDKEKVWQIISEPGNLNKVHPFCKSNTVVNWDKDKHEDKGESNNEDEDKEMDKETNKDKDTKNYNDKCKRSMIRIRTGTRIVIKMMIRMKMR